MSTQFQVPGQRARPTSVSAAAYAQFAVGLIALISTVLGVIQTMAMLSRMEEVLTDEAGGSISAQDIDSIIAVTSAITFVVLIGILLFAAVVAILGIFNLKGKNGARITTWVLAGLGLACSICGSIGGAANSLSGTGGTSASDELTRTMENAAAMPAWYNATSIGLTVLNVILYLAIIILLAVPASNDYFRKPKGEVDIMLPPEAYQDAPPPPPAASAPPTETPRPSTEEPPPGDSPDTPKP